MPHGIAASSSRATAAARWDSHTTGEKGKTRKPNVRNPLARIVFASGPAYLAAVLAGAAWGKDSQGQSSAEAARQSRNEKIDAAKDKIQAARDSAQEARQDSR